MRNTSTTDNIVLRESLEALRGRLPQGWTLGEPRQSTTGSVVRVSSPDRHKGTLVIDPRTRLDPKGVRALADQLDRTPDGPVALVVSPYLSTSTRANLRDQQICFLDLTGNAHIVMSSPGLFIETQGASEAPNREERPARSLRGAKAGQIALALITQIAPPGVRELATRTSIDAGYVSRVLSLLDSEALVARDNRGRIKSVDWPALLRRWAHDAPLDSRGTIRTFLELRGINALKTRLAAYEAPYAITGSLAATQLAPVAPARLALLWVRNASSAASDLGLRPVDSGANVLLVETNDNEVFETTTAHDGLRYAAPAIVAADLLTSPGRGPQEAEELIEWMKTHEERWRK